jgi:UPF0176 protein
MAFVVAAFYRFVGMGDCEGLQRELLDRSKALGVCGTVLLAGEGINGTIAGDEAGIAGMFEFLRSLPGLEGLSYRRSLAEEMPFPRMKVKVKKEIVTFGQAVDPTRAVGTYVSPQDWNALMDDPEVLVLDTRNEYEVAVGSFDGAMNPETVAFREFPDFVAEKLDPGKHTKVAMFCTGGIRCEKASSYLVSQGFGEVYHLEGGILSYLEQVPESESRWRGECFVFDERVTVVHGLAQGSYVDCKSCGYPLSGEERATSDYVVGLHCPYCVSRLTDDQRSRFQMRREQRERRQGG